MCYDWCVFFFQAEDGIRDLVRSRGLGDVYKRQVYDNATMRVRDLEQLEQIATGYRSRRSFLADLTLLSLIHI